MKKYFIISMLLFAIISAKEINISAAANLSSVMKELSAKFLSTHSNDKLNISYSSSGKAYSQIIQGAPIDLFISADTEFPEKLYKNSQSFKPEVYAEGVLVLWSAMKDLRVKSLKDVLDDSVKHIAIPNAELAPYGRAAQEALKKAKLYDKIKSKLINATSISQAHQFVSSLSAEIGFGALSLIDKKAKNVSYIIIDPSLYSPIQQALAITKYGENNPLAKEFKDFLLSSTAKEIFKKYGYVFK